MIASMSAGFSDGERIGTTIRRLFERGSSQSFDEESRHKLKPKHIDRQRERDKADLREAFRRGDIELFRKACDAVGAVEGTKQRKEAEALFKKQHGFS